jgi:hypothetical protein
MIQIQLRPELEAQLATEAQARGMALEHYIAEKLAATNVSKTATPISVAQAIDRLRELRKGNRLDGVSPVEFIREGRKH